MLWILLRWVSPGLGIVHQTTRSQNEGRVSCWECQTPKGLYQLMTCPSAAMNGASAHPRAESASKSPGALCLIGCTGVSPWSYPFPLLSNLPSHPSSHLPQQSPSPQPSSVPALFWGWAPLLHDPRANDPLVARPLLSSILA